MFGPEWTHLLCRGLSGLDASLRAWWEKWLQPAFGAGGAREVTAVEVHNALDGLEAVYEKEIRAEPRISQDLGAIRHLVETGRGPIRMITEEVHSAEVEEARGDGMVSWETTEEGVSKETILQ